MILSLRYLSRDRIPCESMTWYAVLSAASEECLLSAIYTFSSVALPETLNAAQLSCIHGLVSISSIFGIPVCLHIIVIVAVCMNKLYICKKTCPVCWSQRWANCGRSCIQPAMHFNCFPPPMPS